MSSLRAITTVRRQNADAKFVAYGCDLGFGQRRDGRVLEVVAHGPTAAAAPSVAMLRHTPAPTHTVSPRSPYCEFIQSDLTETHTAHTGTPWARRRVTVREEIVLSLFGWRAAVQRKHV